MARSFNDQCSCRHIEEVTRDRIPGSGSAIDPYVHESPRILGVKTPGGVLSLTVNENGCVTLPRSIRKVILAATGETLTPNDLGHISWPNFIRSFTITATDFADPNFGDLTANIVPGQEELKILSVGDPESLIPLNLDDQGLGAVLQNDVLLSGPFNPVGSGIARLSVPQLRTETHSIDNIDYPLDVIVSSNFDTRVDLWPSSRPLAVERVTKAICQVKFNLFFPSETVLNRASHLSFEILDANGDVVHQGFFNHDGARYKTFSYFFPLDFDAPSYSIGNGLVQFRVVGNNLMDNQFSLQINDIEVTYML